MARALSSGLRPSAEPRPRTPGAAGVAAQGGGLRERVRGGVRAATWLAAPLRLWRRRDEGGGDPRSSAPTDGSCGPGRAPLGLLPAAGALTSAALLVLLLPALLPASPERADAAQAGTEAVATPPMRPAESGAPGTSRPAFGPPQEEEVVRALRAWRDALTERAREVEADRTAALALVERIDGRLGELDERIAKLSALREEIRGLLGEVEAREKERIDRLVSVYEGMKPARAARIFDELEMDTLLPIARRMRPARLAVILQSMTPERARELTRRLSERPELPDLSPLGPLADGSGGGRER